MLEGGVEYFSLYLDIELYYNSILHTLSISRWYTFCTVVREYDIYASWAT